MRNWSNKIEALSESFFLVKSLQHIEKCTVDRWAWFFFSTAINICIDCTNYPVLDSFERPALEKDPQRALRLNWVWAILKSGFVPSLWCRYGEISVMSDFPCQWAFRWFWIDFAVIFLMIFDNFLTDGFGIICVITLDVFFLYFGVLILVLFLKIYTFFEVHTFLAFTLDPVFDASPPQRCPWFLSCCLTSFSLSGCPWRPEDRKLLHCVGISVGFALFSQASAPEFWWFLWSPKWKGHPKSSLEKKDFKGAFAVSFGGGTLPPTCFLSGEWDVSKIRFFSMRVIFHFHDSWRKGYV